MRIVDKKKCHNTLVVGVLFPQIIKYYLDYRKSLVNQTDTSFDVLIYCDQLVGNTFVETLDDTLNEIWIINDKYRSPSAIRRYLIEFAIERAYDNIVFSDCDDFYSNNRIEISKRCLESTNIVFNELDLVAEDSTPLSPGFCNEYFRVIPGSYYGIDRIKNGNIIGLSNSAINIKKMGFPKVPIPDGIVATDWWLFSYLLSNNHPAFFTNRCKSFYRQTGFNVAGSVPVLDGPLLLSRLKLKINHYYTLHQVFETTPWIADYYDQYCLLEAELSNRQFLNKYLKMINRNMKHIYDGWWSELVTYEEYKKYV